MTVLDAIPVGEANAVTIAELVRRTGLSRREVEQGIQEARLAGHPVASGSTGVYVAASSAELRATVASLRSRALNQLKTYSATRRTLHRLEAEEAVPLAWEWKDAA